MPINPSRDGRSRVALRPSLPLPLPSHGLPTFSPGGHRTSGEGVLFRTESCRPRYGPEDPRGRWPFQLLFCGQQPKASNPSLWCPLVAKRSSSHRCRWLLTASAGLARVSPDPWISQPRARPTTCTHSLHQPRMPPILSPGATTGGTPSGQNASRILIWPQLRHLLERVAHCSAHLNMGR